jgi:hypothetical protein
MTDTLTIPEAAVILNYKDSRSVESWCKKNNVKIFSAEENNKKYLMRMQFEYARLRKFIDYLKEKYKSEWLDAFKAYLSMDILSVVQLEESEKGKEIVRVKKDNYKLIGEHAKQFLAILTLKTSEL